MKLPYALLARRPLTRRHLTCLAITVALRLVVASDAAVAQSPNAPTATLVVITGLGGEPRFDTRFHAWAATLMDAATAAGLDEASIVYLAGDPDRDPRARDRSTRENVSATLHSLASVPTEEPLFLVVIGHGSHRDGVSKVNLPGPDMTASDFAAALEPFGKRSIVFANLSSASGEIISELSAPGRVIIAATRSGTERNTSIFAQFFAAAFVGDAADADHDNRLSVLEAFDYARREVAQAYGREQKLQTEHAVLDDNGDGEGSAEPGIDADDGRLAASLTLGGSHAAVARAAAGNPELERLYQEKATLVQAVADLRRQKADLGKEEYENRLEKLLIQLALANRAIRDHAASKEEP